MNNGRRRPKLLRANLRPADSGLINEGRVAKQRTRATLLGLVMVSLVLCAVIVHGSGRPFTYRIGQRTDRELRVNVKEFRIRNQTKTSNERQAAAKVVPAAARQNPGLFYARGRTAKSVAAVYEKIQERLNEPLRQVTELENEQLRPALGLSDSLPRQRTDRRA